MAVLVYVHFLDRHLLLLDNLETVSHRTSSESRVERNAEVIKGAVSRQENEFILLEDGEVDYVLEHIVNHVYVQFQVTLCQFFMQLQKATKQLESGELFLVLQN